MKEIIYLDNTLVNSLLAQFDKGVLSRKINSTGSELKSNHTDSKTNEFSGGVSSAVSMSYMKNKSESDASSSSKNDNESQELESNDYKLDMLLERIDDENTGNINILHNDGNIRLYNFKRLEKVMNDGIIDIFSEDHFFNLIIKDKIDKLKESDEYQNSKRKSPKKKAIDNEINKLKKSYREVDSDTFNNIYAVRTFAKMGDALYPDSCLVKIDNCLMICPKDNFRANEATLSLFNKSEKEAKSISIYLYKRNTDDSIYSKTDEDDKGNNGEEITELSVEQVASEAPTMITDLLLDNFKLSKSGDIIAIPIAIYFE